MSLLGRAKSSAARFLKMSSPPFKMYQSGFLFDARSKAQLATVHLALREVMVDAMRLTDVPFQVVQGARTVAEQQALFNAKRSKVNPAAFQNKLDLYRKAKHVVWSGDPLSRAVDIICDVTGKAYDRDHLVHIAGVVLTCSKNRGVEVRWGGNWDRDHEIISDQTFNDLVHFELNT